VSAANLLDSVDITMDNMKRLRLRKTVMVLAKKMLSNELHSLLGADEKFD
jgi:hypothetical protein